MTCIVGVIAKERVYIGADSLGSNGVTKSVRKDGKVFVLGDMVFGFAGSYRMGQALRYSLTVPPRNEEKDIFAYMVTDFVDAVRDCFEKAGFGKKDGQIGEEGGTFMVGYQGRLFVVFDDFQVEEALLPYNAIGCGDQVASGALYALQDSIETNPEKVIKIALQAATCHAVGVEGPFVVESVDAEYNLDKEIKELRRKFEQLPKASESNKRLKLSKNEGCSKKER